ncbi:hypothetical protein [Nostoc favosum]|uniref:DUF5678 domain-containing protein n=1 Tax=Nostoc favosum CHAB5714 TaxID=2780399 RepID=A0ABS8ID16_9NOSO|nr:hypothetical protein [Nostoc favosum]MCC5602105.1 hypothetical protein [Nostoc favosum CHAB5714]
MSEAQSSRTARRGRIFPHIQWTEEHKAQKRAEDENFHQRCQLIFDRVKPEVIETHYNWYMVVEPESGDYFIDQDEEVAMKVARQKHPGTVPLFLFRINDTGVSGTI